MLLSCEWLRCSRCLLCFTSLLRETAILSQTAMLHAAAISVSNQLKAQMISRIGETWWNRLWITDWFYSFVSYSKALFWILCVWYYSSVFVIIWRRTWNLNSSWTASVSSGEAGSTWKDWMEPDIWNTTKSGLSYVARHKYFYIYRIRLHKIMLSSA